MPETGSRNQELVGDFFDTLSAGNLEKLGQLLHEQATWDVTAEGIPGGGLKKGRHEIIEEFLRPARGLFVDGDPKLRIERVISQDPYFAVEARGRGHLKNGKEYANRYAFVIEIKDGKVFALREYMDSHYITTLG